MPSLTVKTAELTIAPSLKMKDNSCISNESWSEGGYDFLELTNDTGRITFEATVGFRAVLIEVARERHSRNGGTGPGHRRR